LTNNTYSIIDIEATGGSPKLDRIMEIAIYNFDGESIIDSYTTLVNPEVEIPPYIQKLTNINNDMVKDAPTFAEIIDRVAEITGGNFFVAHNVNFDYSILKSEFKNMGRRFTRKKLCTVELSKLLMPEQESFSLNSLTKELGIEMESHHRAGDDAKATVELFDYLLKHDLEGKLQKRLQMDFDHYNLPKEITPDMIKQIPEDTGVYYFNNEEGKLVYAGSTNDLRERVLNHFLPVEGSKKRDKLHRTVREVEYEETGSELLAKLKEAEAILSKKPVYNRPSSFSKLRYGIVIALNSDGYKTVRVTEIKEGQKVLTAFRSAEQAEAAIYKRMERYKLCAKLCGKNRGKGPCSLFKGKRCKGACIKRESAASYNKKVNKAFNYYRMPHEKFMIVGEGRTVAEHSGVLVENNKVVGYAYFEKSNDAYEEIIGDLTDLPQHILFKNIILKYLDKQHLDRIVQL